PERRRAALRKRPLDTACRRPERLQEHGRLEPAGGHRRLAVSERRDESRIRNHGDPQRLTRHHGDDPGARRPEPGRADRPSPAARLGLQGERDQAVGQRSERARDRPRPTARRRHRRTGRVDGDDFRRQVLADDDRTGAVSRRLRVAVLMGGRSSEHDISVASARSVLESLDPERYEAVTVEIDREGKWELQSGEARGLGAGAGGVDEGEGHTAVETLPVPTETVPATLADVDVVIPILHGPFGEDGTVQGLLELAGVPYVGAGVLGSAMAMDKDLFKAVMRDSEIPVTRNITLREGDELGNPFGYPVFVKPARLGSSVGITKVHKEEELGPAVELAFRHDEKVLVEEFVEGIEVECG